MKEQNSKTFTQWMDQFGAEQEAIAKAEAKTAARRALFAKLRGVAMSLTGVALVAGGFVYRAEIGQWLHDKTGFGPAPLAEGGESSGTGAAAADRSNKDFKEGARENFGNNLKAAQDFAKERDRLLAEIQGGADPAPAK